jgi:hypothetical protein
MKLPSAGRLLTIGEGFFNVTGRAKSCIGRSVDGRVGGFVAVHAPAVDPTVAQAQAEIRSLP